MAWGSMLNMLGASSGIGNYGFLIKGNPYTSPPGNGIAISSNSANGYSPVFPVMSMSKNNGASWAFGMPAPWGSGTQRRHIWYKVHDQAGVRLVENSRVGPDTVLSIGAYPNSSEISLAPADGFFSIGNFSEGTPAGNFYVRYTGGPWGAFYYKAAGDSDFGYMEFPFGGTTTLYSNDGRSATVYYGWSWEWWQPVGYPAGDTTYTGTVTTIAEPAYAYWQPLLLAGALEFPITITLYNRGYTAGAGATDQQISLYRFINLNAAAPSGELIATSEKITLVGSTASWAFNLDD